MSRTVKFYCVAIVGCIVGAAAVPAIVGAICAAVIL